jgi:hypothetical protein
VAELARRRSDWELLGRAALGSQGLGARSGTQDAAIARMLREAEEYLAATDASPVLRSQLLAALTHMARHGSAAEPRRDMVATAERAVELAESAGDPTASAAAQLALHDALWAPGSAEVRLPVIAAMLAASDDPELVARAHLLRATAMLELGDPAGLDELLTYVAQAEALGHGRGRWGALTRRATYAQIAGQVDDAVRLGEQALELVALGADEGEQPLDAADPLWPLFPLFRAWAPAARGQAAEARAALGDFSVQVIAGSYDLEREAIAAAVFAVAGTDAQRRWAYDQLAPYTGLHVVVSGAVAYHAAVDHHLGTLAAALGDTVAAERHHRAALAQHHKLGAAGWARISEQALAALSVDEQPRHEFRRGDDGGWLLTFDDLTTTLPDAKGLHDLRAIIAAGGREVHVLDLAGGDRRFGADEVLDDQARAAYRARIAVLDEHIEDAEARGDADRSDDLRAERTAIIRELAAATGLSGRSRRLGDSAERARKTVSARVRDVLTKIDQVHPALATHLRTSLRMGTTCTYHPTHPVSWNLTDHAPAQLS